MKNIHTAPYLNEHNLGEILDVVFGADNVTRQKSVRVSGRTLRIDYCVETPNKTIFVEFNGQTHYTNTMVILRDYELRDFCEENGIRLVEIPYFIQVTNYNFTQLFGIEYEDLLSDIQITSEVSCGFVSKKIVLPLDYCIPGLSRFYQDYRKSNGSMFIDSKLDKDSEWWKTMQEIYMSIWNRSDLEIALMENFFTDTGMDVFFHYPT